MESEVSEQARGILCQPPVDGRLAGCRRGCRATPTVFPVPLRVHESDIPEDAALDELEHVPVKRVRTTLEAGLEHPTGRGKCRRRNRACVFNRGGERRLAIDVFSSLQRRKSNIAMFGCRRRDDDGFDLWGFNHTPPLGSSLRTWCAGGG